MDDESTLTIDEFGHKRWRLPNGKLHCVDGPAVEYTDGHKHWYLNDIRHRLDGPAVEYADGTKLWYQNNLSHREDGPADEWANGDKTWWLNGRYYYNFDEWLEANNFISEEAKLMLKLTYG
jgi:hypothetical protein